MILVQTIGAVDLPGKASATSPLGGAGTRKMPSPRVYVPIVVLWGILGLVAETGAEQSRLASKLSLLVLLTGALLGPFGTTAIKFLNTVSTNFAIPAPASPPVFGTASATTDATAPEGVIV
jgi:hypothetical protein